MATGENSRDVRCPFYKTDKRCQIKCEGYRADMTSVHINFMTPDHHRKYIRLYCCDRYRSCYMYKLIMKVKYPDH